LTIFEKDFIISQAMGKKIYIEPKQSAKDIFEAIQKLIPADKRKPMPPSEAPKPKV
jgi:hypothetical protein